jgi:hypothetical protein
VAIPFWGLVSRGGRGSWPEPFLRRNCEDRAEIGVWPFPVTPAILSPVPFVKREEAEPLAKAPRPVVTPLIGRKYANLPRIAAGRKGDLSAWDLANGWRQADYGSAGPRGYS